MAIKVTLGATENTQQEKPFPKLMIDRIGYECGIKHNRCLIVFFEKPSCGTVIQTSTSWPIGCYSDAWIDEAFVDYNEPITIQNL
jgi:hypothetical protein